MGKGAYGPSPLPPGSVGWPFGLGRTSGSRSGFLAAQDPDQCGEVSALLDEGLPQRQELGPLRRELLGDGGAQAFEHQHQEWELVGPLGRHLAQQPIGRVAVDVQRGPIREQSIGVNGLRRFFLQPGNQPGASRSFGSS
jgi:hypothetical protein